MAQQFNNDLLIKELLEGKTKLAVLGLGYVGLPLVLAFGKLIKVIGYDRDADRVKSLQNGFDQTGEKGCDDFKGIHAEFSSDPAILADAQVYIVAVPTPVDDHKVPWLEPLLSVSRTIGQVLKPGDVVIYESTVYPGCTEEECVPILELASGLKSGVDFKFGFSPERINPGDLEHTLENTVKVAAGCDPDASECIAALYRLVVKAGVHQVSSVKVAETAKIIENTQRDLNIALMNELSIICNRMGVNTFEALEAASTKWNFLAFSPGLVGGHCIGVDPYYLTYKATKLGYHPHVILAGRYVNDSMGFYIAKQTVKKLLEQKKNLAECSVLVMGFTFKEDVGDIRNTRVADLVKEIESYQVKVDVIDSLANSEEVRMEYGIVLANESLFFEDNGARYDAIVVAVAHKQYMGLPQEKFLRHLKSDGLLIDVKGVYRGKIGNCKYWSL